jgi:hypothetical protein
LVDVPAAVRTCHERAGYVLDELPLVGCVVNRTQAMYEQEVSDRHRAARRDADFERCMQQARIRDVDVDLARRLGSK